MYPSSRLKLNSVFFALAWTIGMLLLDGNLDRINLIETSIFGAACGYLWYRIMRKRLPRGRVPERRRVSHAKGAAS
jgi:hypothetical protein